MSEFFSTEGVKVAVMPTGALLVDADTHIPAKHVRALREYFGDAGSALDDARAALADFDEHGVIFGPNVATALRALIAEHERLEGDRSATAAENAELLLENLRLTAPPTDEEREALARVIEEGWGNPTWDGKTLRPIDRQIAEAVLAAGFRRRGPITDAQVEAAYDAALRAGAGQLTRGDVRAALEAARAVS